MTRVTGGGCYDVAAVVLICALRAQVRASHDMRSSWRGDFMLMMRLMLRISLGVIMVSPIFAQDYPSKPIRIVTSAAGGGSDFVARQTAQGISGPLGQSVIVENRGSPILA